MWATLLCPSTVAHKDQEVQRLPPCGGREPPGLERHGAAAAACSVMQGNPRTRRRRLLRQRALARLRVGKACATVGVQTEWNHDEAAYDQAGSRTGPRLVDGCGIPALPSQVDPNGQGFEVDPNGQGFEVPESGPLRTPPPELETPEFADISGQEFVEQARNRLDSIVQTLSTPAEGPDHVSAMAIQLELCGAARPRLTRLAREAVEDENQGGTELVEQIFCLLEQLDALPKEFETWAEAAGDKCQLARFNPPPRANAGSTSISDDAVYAEDATNPLAKVLGLIDELKTKIVVEGEVEQKAYDEYLQWCQNTVQGAGFAMETATKARGELEAKITELSAEIVEACTNWGLEFWNYVQSVRTHQWRPDPLQRLPLHSGKMVASQMVCYTVEYTSDTPAGCHFQLTDLLAAIRGLGPGAHEVERVSQALHVSMRSDVDERTMQAALERLKCKGYIHYDKEKTMVKGEG